MEGGKLGEQGKKKGMHRRKMEMEKRRKREEEERESEGWREEKRRKV